jgi:hypothetical protein
MDELVYREDASAPLWRQAVKVTALAPGVLLVAVPEVGRIAVGDVLVLRAPDGRQTRVRVGSLAAPLPAVLVRVLD